MGAREIRDQYGYHNVADQPAHFHFVRWLVPRRGRVEHGSGGFPLVKERLRGVTLAAARERMGV